MDGRFHDVAKLRQLSLLAVLLLSWLLPTVPAVARCYNPAAIASRIEEQLKEEQALAAKTAYIGVFDPGEKVQIGLFRWYDPNLQRFINRDPLGEASDSNLYRFVLNNPNSFVDPDGESALGSIGGVVGGTIGGGFGAIIGAGAGTVTVPVLGTISLGWGGAVAGGGIGYAGGYAWGEWVNTVLGGGKTQPLVCPMGMGGKRGWAGSNPDADKAAADKAAGRDRATGKLDRPPQEKVDPSTPPDPLRGLFPGSGTKDLVPKDGLPAPIRSGR